ncbi:MAG: metallophosphoesterase, partial [Verrucomicrobia bacterium]|nr:metallophosphoesterase [Verrucomicrobiota bacterium]
MEDRGTDATVAIISDIHYAGLEERARGEDYEFQAIANPFLRRLARAYRHNVWMRHPFSQAKQLERFLARDIGADLLIANGDYSCDTAFLGLSDPAAFQSASECVHLLRARFGERVLFTLGDHEFGKLTLFGGKGGMRLAGWHRATVDLGLKAFWKRSVGRYALMGVASSLIALPAQEADVLPE